jgi:hypothetical protein
VVLNPIVFTDKNDVAVFLHEVRCRERGLKWEDSWGRWRETAEEMGATPYGDVVAYRNEVNDLRKRFEWVREHLDAMRRATGRPWRMLHSEAR